MERVAQLISVLLGQAAARDSAGQSASGEELAEVGRAEADTPMIMHGCEISATGGVQDPAPPHVVAPNAACWRPAAEHDQHRGVDSAAMTSTPTGSAPGQGDQGKEDRQARVEPDRCGEDRVERS